MTNATYGELALERIVKEKFGLTVEVRQLIADQVPVSRTDEATLFLTTKKQLYLYVNGRSRLLLSDIKKIVSRMGLRAELYIPPRGQPQYFDEIGRAKFREIFPGRGHITDVDIVYYRTLAPYNPALVQVAEVKNGEVYQYDSDSYGDWRVAARFAYRRIKTS